MMRISSTRAFKSTSAFVLANVLGAMLGVALSACDSGEDPPPAAPSDSGTSSDVTVNDAGEDVVGPRDADDAELVVDASVEPVGCTVTPCAVEIAAGASSVCVRLNDGTVRCWGSNGGGELGRGPDAPLLSATPTAVTGLANVTQLSGAASDPSDTYCARRSDGATLCWGSNAFGVLGRVDGEGNVMIDSSPDVAPVNGVTGASGVFVGRSVACATLAQGISCWGTNASAQLPSAPADAPPLPAMPIALTGAITSLGIADRGTIALTSEPSLLSWGLGGDPLGPGTGVLGREVSLERAAPGPIALSRVSAIAAGPSRACAIANGRVFCWGAGPTPGSDSVYPTPAGVGSTLAIAQTIAVGTKTACATLSDGSAVCWGDNSKGQLGTGDADLRPVPVSVQGLAARPVRIATMDGATCAILVSGAVQCWGKNDKGQLGSGTADALAHLVPQNVELAP